MNEWISVRDYEGIYEVNKKGEIRSCDREIFQPGHGFRRIKGQMIKPWDNGNGYQVVSLLKEGKRKNHYVHRIVAEHFIPNPNNLKEVNHIDYDPSNNCVSNLEWIDRIGNVKHSIINMKHPRMGVARTNTGYLYITKQKNENTYRIIVSKKERRAKTLEEAISIRDEMIRRRDECLQAF